MFSLVPNIFLNDLTQIHPMRKRSQTSTEYLVIVSVVIILAVIVISVLGGIPSVGVGSKSTANSIALRTAVVATDAFVVSNTSTVLHLRNNDRFQMLIDAIEINGISCDASFPLTLRVGAKLEVACSNINNSNAGTAFDYPYAITHTNFQTQRSFTIPLPNLKGVVSGTGPSVSNPPHSEPEPEPEPEPPSLGSCSVIESSPLTVFLNGSGSAEDPYQICNCTMLQNMNLDLDANYVLIDDIDCSETSTWNSGEGFDPVGTSSSAFVGVFDGAHYTISNLFINRSSENYVGLFGNAYTDDSTYGVFHNVGLESLSISGRQYTAGLVGNGRATRISNVTLNGTVIGLNLVGFLVGEARSAVVSNISASGTVSGDNTFGGVIGSGYLGIFENSSFTGSVISYGSTSSDKIGGFIGSAQSAQLFNITSNATVNGTSSVGGLVGFGLSATIDLSQSHGIVNGTAASSIVKSGIGGLVGSMTSGTLSDSSTTARVYCVYLSEFNSPYCGGLVGRSGFTSNTPASTWVNHTTDTANGCVGQSGTLVGTTHTNCNAILP